MTGEEIQRLISQGEGPTLEFKVSIPRPETAACIIASFANTEGGQILFGVKEPPQIVGIREEEIRNSVELIKAHLSGDINFDLNFIDIEDLKIGILEVAKSNGLVAADGGYYQRVNDRSYPMSAEDIKKRIAPRLSKDTEPNEVIEKQDIALTQFSEMLERQTQMIEKMQEQYRKNNALWKKILLMTGGALAGQVFKFAIDYLS
jgi:predicted HTH transcriptional regulator